MNKIKYILIGAFTLLTLTGCLDEYKERQD